MLGLCVIIGVCEGIQYSIAGRAVGCLLLC